MSAHRDKLMNEFFENMDQAKRGMQGWLKIGDASLLSRSQIELLLTIRHHQPISFSELAKHLQLTTGAISQLVEALEKHELVSREKDPHDRRIQRLRLSKHGNKQLLIIEKRRRTMLEAVMADLSDEELETWLKIQQKMVARFQAADSNNTEEND